jgi:hypothetical protein
MRSNLDKFPPRRSADSVHQGQQPLASTASESAKPMLSTFDRKPSRLRKLMTGDGSKTDAAYTCRLCMRRANGTCLFLLILVKLNRRSCEEKTVYAGVKEVACHQSPGCRQLIACDRPGTRELPPEKSPSRRLWSSKGVLHPLTEAPLSDVQSNLSGQRCNCRSKSFMKSLRECIL